MSSGLFAKYVGKSWTYLHFSNLHLVSLLGPLHKAKHRLSCLLVLNGTGRLWNIKFRNELLFESHFYVKNLPYFDLSSISSVGVYLISASLLLVLLVRYYRRLVTRAESPRLVFQSEICWIMNLELEFISFIASFNYILSCELTLSLFGRFHPLLNVPWKC